ncbi:tRNA(His) guanylyltransferase Thg1 family protein [Sphaerisporangium aureirubrum]|uniref:tRNA(His) guanylyltransferase Thg1 family protein n=1 Tax=Sphaerisporangium aureirubrum TaxID=1544736 RepID=A0ABW1NDJ7_9ACTN
MSTDKTALGDRMKAYEAVTRTVLPRRSYALIRVDIRAAHTYLRGADKPFDTDFMDAMDTTARALCEEIAGAVFAYTQSDEISVLFTDLESIHTQPWFGGVAAKMVSISAAAATAAFNAAEGGRNGALALFDSRVFTLPNAVEVANYVVWRQRDAVRNSISMAAQARFTPSELHGKPGREMQEMLWQHHGINWNDYPAGVKRGRVCTRKTGEREVAFVDQRTAHRATITALRSWWEIEAAPHFAADADGWLAQTIPPLPSLEVPAQGPLSVIDSAAAERP